MASFLDVLKGVGHQLNPFDSGRTYDTHQKGVKERSQERLQKSQTIAKNFRSDQIRFQTHLLNPENQADFSHSEFVDSFAKTLHFNPEESYYFKAANGKTLKIKPGQLDVEGIKNLDFGTTRKYINSLITGANQGSTADANTLALLQRSGVLDGAGMSTGDHIRAFGRSFER